MKPNQTTTVMPVTTPGTTPKLTAVPNEPTVARRGERLRAVDCVNTALAQESFEIAATAVASELARAFDCDHVVVGMMHGAVPANCWPGPASPILRQEFAWRAWSRQPWKNRSTRMPPCDFRRNPTILPASP